MAAVFEIEEPGTGRRLALKLLTQRGLARPRFDREYRSLTRLDHPNIVRVYQFGMTADNQAYLTMELVEGVPAQVFAKAQGRPGTPARTARVLRVIAQVALALAYLHDRGLVHRDLKSSNVMVLSDGGVKLLDFGTARLLDPDDEITRHGEFVGTFAYAAPEQLTGAKVDARADLYSLGVLLYRMLTGTRPFDADNPHSLARMHLEHTPSAPAEMVAGVSPEVSALVMRLLAKDAVERPSSAWVVYEALQGRDRHPVGTGPRAEDLCAPEVVGREAEVALLRAVLDDTAAGRMALVRGGDGSGRERLLQRVGEDARGRRMAVFAGAFPGGPGMGALGSVARAIGRGLPVRGGGLADPDVATITSAAISPPDDAEAEAAVQEALVSLVQRRAAATVGRVFISLQDLHRAPPIALRALFALRRQALARGIPVCIVASAPLDDDGDALQQLVCEGATAVTLGPLNPIQVGRLVGAVLGRRAPPPALSARLHAATGGMPGHVVEVVHAMVREGLIVARRTPDDRVAWLDRSGGRITVPDGIREQVGLRLAALTAPTLRALEALAVVGMPISVDAVAFAVDIPSGEAAEALDRLKAARLAKASAEGWAPSLGLIGQLVREGARASRRALLRARLATALQDAPPNAGKIRLLLEAGLLEAAARDAVAWAPGALVAQQASDVAPVLVRLHDAMASATGDPLDSDLRCQVGLLAAEATACVDPGDRRAAGILEELVPSDPLRAAADLIQARVLRLGGDPGGATGALGRARTRMRRHPDAVLALAIDLEQGRARAQGGDATGSLTAFQAAARAAAELRDPVHEEAARLGAGLARFALGDLEASEADLDWARSSASQRGDRPGALHAAVHQAEALRVQGRHTTALALLEPHMDRARLGQRPFLHSALLLAFAGLGLELFRLGEVRVLLAELDAIELARAHPWLRAEVARTRGRLLLAGDDWTAAGAILEPAVRESRESARPVSTARLLGWLGAAQGMAGRSTEAAASMGEAMQLLARHRHMPVLAEVCARRSDSGPASLPVRDAWAPVLGWIEQEPARLARVEWALARLRDARSSGHPDAVRGALAVAQDATADFTLLLAPHDAAALRVHPWQVQLDRAAASLA
jgi:hypothetical protein